MERINVAVADGLNPNLTLLLDIDPVLALARIELKERHRIEREDIDFYRKVREGCLEQAAKHPERIKVFDASLSPEEIFGKVWLETSKIITG